MRLNRAQKKKIIRRSVSLTVALAMLLNETYIWSIIDSVPFLDTNNNRSRITAYADEETGNDLDFPHDDEATNEIRVPLENFKEYSDSCQIYSTYHQYDKITIYSTGTSDLFESGFSGLGTQSKPFGGSIEIAANTDITLNLDAPLFNYVYDSVTINNGKALPISRYYMTNGGADETTPVVAKYVYHDSASQNVATWNINLTTPSDSTDHYLSQFGGFLGTMDDDNGAPKLELKVTMNTATLTKESVTKTDNGAVKINGNDDLGLACGHMDSGAELTFIYNADRAISMIETTGGDVGGLVGEMEAGAVFSLKNENTVTKEIDITTSAGSSYAGGLVGKNVGGTVLVYEAVADSAQSNNSENTGEEQNGGNGEQNVGDEPNNDNEGQNTGDEPNNDNEGQDAGGDANTDDNGQTAGDEPNDGDEEQNAGDEPNNDNEGQDAGGDANTDDNGQTAGDEPNDGDEEQNAGGEQNNNEEQNTGEESNSGEQQTAPDVPAIYPVTQHITGTSGAGGVYGYYKPTSALTGDDSFDTSIYAINCQVNGTGYTGGLFGVLETEVDVTINGGGTIISNHASENCTGYGGLIGQYKTDDVARTLTISSVTANPSKGGGASYYGGGIGEIDDTDPSYVEFSSFTTSATNAGSLTFGGLAAKADKAFIKTTGTNSVTASEYKGGGLVGRLKNGVLQICGANTITSSSAAPGDGEELKVGKIVGYRDNGLVFMDSDASCTAGTSAVDDIGSWGGVIKLSGFATPTNVLSVSGHDVTIGTSGYDFTSIANNEQFAITALRFQIDGTECTSTTGEGENAVTVITGNPFVTFANNSKTSESIAGTDISLSGAVTLTGTGIYSLTRDNDIGSSMAKCVYSKTFGNASTAYTITFDTGTIYRHKYNGLFAKLNGGSVRNVTFAGKIDVNAKTDMYVGAAAATATGNFAASNVTVGTDFDYAGSETLYLGGILGEADSSIGTINVTGCTVNADISGNNSEGVIGGVIGQISHNADAAKTWNFTNVNVSGTISNSSSGKIGGLVSVINGGYNGNSNHRILTFSGVTINGLEVSGSSADSMGGLLGYSWLKTDVNVDSVTVKDNSSNKPTVSNSAVGGIGGMVYRATGKWTVTSLDIKDIVVSGSGSVGMIVNKGISHDNSKFYTEKSRSAIFLCLPSGYTYNITSATLPSVTVFDELCAYTAPDADSVLRNGNGVISINSSAFRTDGSTASGSYHARTAKGASANPNSRYYYNLDITTAGSASATIFTYNASSNPNAYKNQLMSWGLNQYACKNLTQYFADSFSNTIPNQTYDMQDYSWYPVDLDKSVTVNGTFKFYSHEFEKSEDVKAANEYDRTNEYTDPDNAVKTQHYTMHSGLFRNVSSGNTLTIGTTVFQGDVGLIDGGSGALICGTVQGASNTSKATVNVTGSVSLDGVYVYGAESNYAPLLINKVGSYTNLTMKNVSATNKYLKDNVTPAVTDPVTPSTAKYISKDSSGYPKAASNLIGDVGLSDVPTGITINFSNIKLDGRKAAVSEPYNSQLTTVYGSDLTIFTRSTLLNQFKYASGSTGTYNYESSEDWDNGSHTGKGVTYGKEVGYTSADTDTEYPGKEQKYSGTSGFYTSPVQPSASEAYSYFKTGFLPYVYVPYNKDNKTHQLRVNHEASTATGCGTYNDPYILSDGSKLEAFCDWINNGAFANPQDILIPTAGLVYNSTDNTKIDKISGTWCEGKTAHATFTYNGTVFNGTVGGTARTITPEVMRAYLAGAYYQIPEEVDTITIPSSNTPDHTFNGLGNSTVDYAVFRGVIDGNGRTIINNTGYPLIEKSNGSVAKDLTIVATPASGISLTGYQNTFDADTNPNESYGAVMAKILGGDNIIDNVSISLGKSSTEKMTINLTGDYAQLVPVGAYVGVVVNGGLYFRNMARIDENGNEILYNESLFNNATFSANANGGTDTAPMSDSNMEWLYVNPIVGRVINGFAVTEGNVYRPYEDGTRTYKGGTSDKVAYWDETTQKEVDTAPASLSHVTMQNGNKHYSIPDISSSAGKLNTKRTDDSKVGVPDGQAFFVMSAIVNSGMSNQSLGYSNLVVGGGTDPNKNYFVSRSNADYSYIGKIPAVPTQPGEGATEAQTAAYNTALEKYNAAIGDYNKAKTDGTAIRGYLMTEYATGGINISGGGGTKQIKLTSDKYYLPDGYKGIGNMYQGNDNYRMNITGFDGNGATVSLNSGWYYYMNDISETLTGDTVNNAHLKLFDTVYHHHTNVGFGLFNYQNGATNSASNRYYNFILKGNVITDCIDSSSDTGNHIIYKGTRSTAGYDQPHYKNNVEQDVSLDGDYMVSAGGLMGVTNNSQWLDRVALQNMYVHGLRYSGGLIGLNIGANDTVFTYKNTKPDGGSTLPSSEIKIHGASTCGGMIGKNQFANIDIDNGDASYSITEVVSECTNMAGSDFNYGVGGFIGACRTGPSGGATTNTITIQNITVGNAKQEKPSEVKAENADIFTGGMIGILNKGTLTITNCTINNQTVSTKYIAGGLCGYYATATGEGNISNVKIYAKDYKSSTITNPHITSTNKAAGGFFGSLKDEFNVNGSTNPGNTLNIFDSQIDGYTISAPSDIDSYAGGAVGLFGHFIDGTNTNNILNLHDIDIQNCSVNAKNAGGVIGGMAEREGKYKYFYGYNILTKDVTITGNIIGSVCGKMLNTTDCVIKLAGFSRQGTISTPNIVGSPRSGVTKTYQKSYYYVVDENGRIVGDKIDETELVPAGEEELNNNPRNSYSGTVVKYGMPSDDVTLADLVSTRGQGGFYLSLDNIKNGTVWQSPTHDSPFYVSSSYYSEQKGLYETNEKTYNQTYSKAVWYFEKDGDNYKLYTLINGTKKYIKGDVKNRMKLDSNGDSHSITYDSNLGCFHIQNVTNGNNKNGYLQHSSSGSCFRYYQSVPALGDEANYNIKLQFVQQGTPLLHATSYDTININGTSISNSGTGTSAELSAFEDAYNTYCAGHSSYSLYYVTETIRENESTEAFGDESYIIFSDYDGTVSNEHSQNMYDSSTNTVTDASPFVTLNPQFTITDKGAAEQYLTGDGISSPYYAQSVFKKIIDDSADRENKPKAYTLYTLESSENETSENAVAKIKAEYSNSATEFKGYSGYENSGIKNFPLLIAEDTNRETLTDLINNYLRTLTNTKDYNFADTVTYKEIFDIGLYKCTFNANTKVFDVDTTTPSTACLKKDFITANDVTSYYFKMDAGDVDTQDIPQFSLLDVKFFDPSSVSYTSGNLNTGSLKVAYHLYVPIYVKKVLRFNFNAEIENGTDYYWTSYSKLGKNLSKQGFFENLGNPVTIAFEYEYDRTATEWKDAVNGGDSLLTNYYKSLSLKNHNNNGWAANTKMVLVDANNSDKYYYLDTPPTSTPTTISLFDFEDDSGIHYSPVNFKDLMTVTVVQSDDGTLTKTTGNTSTGATVYDGTYYYRPITDTDTSLSPSDKYTVSEITNIKTEKYYLSIFTKAPETSATAVYRYEIKSAESFAASGTGETYTAETWNVNSWRANKIDKNTVINLFTGKLYQNDLTLTVTPKQSGTQAMSGTNNYLTIDMKAKVALTNTARDSGVGDNMFTFRNDAYIYQTFLMMYDKLAAVGGTHEIGIDLAANAKVGINSYFFTGGNISTALTSSNATAVSKPQDKKIESAKYIELRNDENLISMLGDSGKGYAATLQVNFDMVYAADDLSTQFPTKDPTNNNQSSIGTNVIGYSKISSTIEGAANSATYDKKCDGDGNTLYYTTSESTATLKYNVEETPKHKAGRYSYLGINSVETGDDEVFVDTYAVYDTHKLANAGDFIELTLTLSNKDDGYVTPVVGNPIPTGENTGTALTIGNYIKELKIYGADGNNDGADDVIFDQTADAITTGTVRVTSKGTTLYTVRVKKGLLKTQAGDEDGIYVIPITFKVFTGNTKFKISGLEYSNYKVSLTAATYSAISGDEYTKSSYAFDHIIYTNARVLTSVVN